MLETATVAFVTLFATIGPIDIGAIFAGLTASYNKKKRKSIAVRSTLIGFAILFFFAIIGQKLLENFGITLAALRTSGGILLLLIGIDMVFAKQSGATSTTEDEQEEASNKDDIAVFPMATPLIAGPGTMGAVILLMAEAEGNYLNQGIVIGALIANLTLTYLILRVATKMQKFLGVTGVHVITRVMGVLLAGLAVQFIFDGIRDSGVFKFWLWTF